MDLQKLPLRRIRLRAIWILVPVFLWLARPTIPLLVAGAAVGGVGCAIRSWAAGVIVKDRVLTTSGPYAHTRNPLYLGTFFLGLGLTLASARPSLVAAFLVLFLVVYGLSMKREAQKLEEAFGDEYRAYAEDVPLFVPRLRPYRGGDDEGGFDPARYRRHGEHHSLLVLVLGFGALVARMLLR